MLKCVFWAEVMRLTTLPGKRANWRVWELTKESRGLQPFDRVTPDQCRSGVARRKDNECFTVICDPLVEIPNC